jgi:hypothetical protein
MKPRDVNDLVEQSIRYLDEGVDDDRLFCAHARRLYDFQDSYSTDVTYFRVMPLLVERGVFLKVPREDHPDFDEADALSEEPMDAVAPVLESPDDAWDEQANPVVGYLGDGDIYTRADSSLAERLVETGAVEADRAGLPDPSPLFGAVRQVCEAARASSDEEADDTILLWYTNLSFHVALEGGAEMDKTVESLKEDGDLQALRSMVAQVVGGDLEMALGHPDCPAEAPPHALRQKHPVLQWWYALG